MQSGDQNTQNAQHDQDLPGDQVQGSSLVSDAAVASTQDATQDATQTPSEKRVRLQRERRIQRILAVSQRLFSTRAYDTIAIEDIAAEAGISKGLLYYYFASKRDLYVATVAHVLRQTAHLTDFRPDLHAGLVQMVSLFEQSPGLAKMVLCGGIGVDTEVEALLSAYRQRQLERLYHGLGYLGELADDSMHTPAGSLVVLGLRGWSSLLDEVCLQWVQQPEAGREQVVRFLEQSLHAIIATATSRRSVDDGLKE